MLYGLQFSANGLTTALPATLMTLNDSEQALIAEARATPNSTLRSVSTGLERILHEALLVLDHGFIRVVDYMGDDASIVQSARVSYGKGTKHKRDDSTLINFLMQNRHTTPFEMAEIKLHVRLPIFVARQWVRHRTANINEYSARYSLLDKEFYIPEPDQLAAQSKTNRQGRGQTLDGPEASHVLRLLRDDAERAYGHYLDLLNEDTSGKERDPKRFGLARELARMNLSLNYYTQWYWKIDLHNLMHFIQLRIDPHAQYEIRAYADILLDIMQRWVPITTEAFQEHRLGALTLSASAVRAVTERIAGKRVTADTSGVANREWQVLQRILGL